MGAGAALAVSETSLAAVDEFGFGHLQGGGQALEYDESDVATAVFDAGQVGDVDRRPVRKLVLRQALAFARPPNIASHNPLKIHVAE